MRKKKRILLKLTGEAFLSTSNNQLSPIIITNIISQIKELSSRIHFGIVVGGGNFFRGNEHGKKMGIRSAVGHQIGMIATLMNGLMLKDLLEQQNLSTALFTAITCPEVGVSISQQAIENALESNYIMVFAGGTGNPYFSTDTTAVLRGLQIYADEIWKATHVDGVYDVDPKKDPKAQLLPSLTFDYALKNKLSIMDATAFTLASENKQIIRVFNIFMPNALQQISDNQHIGSIIHP